MKVPDDSVYLHHILDAIAKIERYIAAGDQAFMEDSLVQDGVVRQLQIIGEATRRLSPELRDHYPDIPWKKIFGMRNKLVHDYFGVDLDAVWDTATNDVLPLKAAVERILGDVSSAP